MKLSEDFQQDKKSVSKTINKILDRINYISGEINDLFKLQLQLGMLEVKDAGKKFALDSITLIAGAILGLISLLVLTVLLILILGNVLPISQPWNYTVSTGIILLLYIILSSLLIINGLKKIRSKSLLPTATIDEIKIDKEWIKGIPKS